MSVKTVAGMRNFTVALELVRKEDLPAVACLASAHAATMCLADLFILQDNDQTEYYKTNTT